MTVGGLARALANSACFDRLSMLRLAGLTRFDGLGLPRRAVFACVDGLGLPREAVFACFDRLSMLREVGSACFDRLSMPGGGVWCLHGSEQLRENQDGSPLVQRLVVGAALGALIRGGTDILFDLALSGLASACTFSSWI